MFIHGMLKEEIPIAMEGIQVNNPEKPDMDLTSHFFKAGVLIF